MEILNENAYHFWLIFEEQEHDKPYIFKVIKKCVEDDNSFYRLVSCHSKYENVLVVVRQISIKKQPKLPGKIAKFKLKEATFCKTSTIPVIRLQINKMVLI